MKACDTEGVHMGGGHGIQVATAIHQHRTHSAICAHHKQRRITTTPPSQAPGVQQQIITQETHIHTRSWAPPHPTYANDRPNCNALHQHAHTGHLPPRQSPTKPHTAAATTHRLIGDNADDLQHPRGEALPHEGGGQHTQLHTRSDKLAQPRSHGSSSIGGSGR